MIEFLDLPAREAAPIEFERPLLAALAELSAATEVIQEHSASAERAAATHDRMTAPGRADPARRRSGSGGPAGRRGAGPDAGTSAGG